MKPTPQVSALPISIRGVTKFFGTHCALDEISLEVASGEFLSLLGPSGSGKSTLLMILAGFVQPDTGSVRFGSREILLTPPHHRGIGMVFQNYALFPHLNVRDNVLFPLRLRRMERAEAARRVQAVLELVKLGNLGERRIGELSGGQQQRVALARALVFEPPILLFDEPLSALDKKLRESMQIEIRRLHEQLGLTTVYVTHDQSEAMNLSDRMAVLNDGKIIQLGKPREVYEKPANLFVADFIGVSTALPIQIRNDGVYLFDRRMDLTPPSFPLKRPHLIMRPERLRLGPQAGREHPNEIRGTVSSVQFQGESMLIRVAVCEGHEVIVREVLSNPQNAYLPAMGEPATIGFGQDDITIVGD